jgi:uncharacterized membrane protein
MLANPALQATLEYAMNGTPLHPLLVHLPLVMALGSPLLLLFFLQRGRRGRAPAWSWLVAYHALLAFSSLAAMLLGEKDEEIIQAVVAHDLVENHERLGNLLTWSAFVALAILLLLGHFKRARPLAWLVLPISLALAGLALLAGHTGAELVYVHGAATAFCESQSEHPTATSPPTDPAHVAKKPEAEQGEVSQQETEKGPGDSPSEGESSGPDDPQP